MRKPQAAMAASALASGVLTGTFPGPAAAAERVRAAVASDTFAVTHEQDDRVPEGFAQTGPSDRFGDLIEGAGVQRGWLGRWNHVRGNDRFEDGTLKMGRADHPDHRYTAGLPGGRGSRQRHGQAPRRRPGRAGLDLRSTDWNLESGHALAVESGTIQRETEDLDPLVLGPGDDWLDTPSNKEVQGSRCRPRPADSAPRHRTGRCTPSRTVGGDIDQEAA